MMYLTCKDCGQHDIMVFYSHSLFPSWILFKNAELIRSIPEGSPTDRLFLSQRIPLFFGKDFAFDRGLCRSGLLNHEGAGKLVQSVQLLLGLACEVVAVVQPLLDDLSGYQQLEWLYLEIHAYFQALVSYLD